jgi:hypothetical protein
VRDDLDDAPVADLVPVAERAVDDVTTPVLREALDLGELVDETGGREHAAGDDRVPADEVDPELVVVGARHARRASGQDLPAVAAHLLTPDGGQLRRRAPFTAEEAVHVCSRRVARLTGVDHQYGATRSSELKCATQAGRATADHDHVVCSCHVVRHGHHHVLPG